MARDRVILVTGGASGIGRAICLALAAPGTALLIHARANRAGAACVARAARSAGARAEIMLGDLVQPDVAGALIAEATARFGALDVLISNAGFADRTALAQLSDAAMARSLEAIQTAFFRLARAAAPHLAAGCEPRVVAVSSFVAHVFRPDVPGFPASAAAKAGLEALVRALALELASASVTVNAVVPGFIRKDRNAQAALDPDQAAAQAARIPLGRIGTPEDVASAVAFLASPAARYITGQALHVSGGLVM